MKRVRKENLVSIKIYLSCSLLLAGSLILLQGCLLPTAKPEVLRTADYGEIIPSAETVAALSKLTDEAVAAMRRNGDLFSNAGEEAPGKSTGLAILSLTEMSRFSGKEPRQLQQTITTLQKRLVAEKYPGGDTGATTEKLMEGNGWLLRGLHAYYAWKNDSDVLDMAEAIVDSLFLPLSGRLNDYPWDGIPARSDRENEESMDDDVWNDHISSQPTGGIFIALEGLAGVYRYRPSIELRRFMEKLSGIIRETDHITARTDTEALLSGIRGLILFSQLTGEESYTDTAVDLWAIYREYGMNDLYGSYPVLDSTSRKNPANVILEAHGTALRLWAQTGDGTYLEDADKIHTNSLLPAFGGSVLPEPFSAAPKNPAGHVNKEVDLRDKLMLGLCMADLVKNSFYVQDYRIMIPYYTGNKLVIPLKNIELEAGPGYPLSGRTEITVTNAPVRGLDLQIFAPVYMQIEKIMANGEESPGTSINRRNLVEFRQRFRKGDTAGLDYSFRSDWSASADPAVGGLNYYKAMYGPAVLTYNADTVLWLDRGVSITRHADNSFTLDPKAPLDELIREYEDTDALDDSKSGDDRLNLSDLIDNNDPSMSDHQYIFSPFSGSAAKTVPEGASGQRQLYVRIERKRE